ALVDILTQPKNALVKQYQKFFEFDGVELEFTVDALEAIADQCILRGTGARGLRAILEEVLLGVMYELPSRQDVHKCVIDEGVVLRGVNLRIADDSLRVSSSPIRISSSRSGPTAIDTTLAGGRGNATWPDVADSPAADGVWSR